VLRFFRINDPYRLLAILIIAIGLGLFLMIDPPPLSWSQLHGQVIGKQVSSGYQLYTEIRDRTPPLTAVFQQVVYALFGMSSVARQCLALIFIFVQAGLFSVILIRSNAYTENTYLPAFLFVITSFFSFDAFQISPELLSSFFLMLVLRSLFKEMEFRQQRDETVFSMGIYLALSSLTVFVHILFLPVSLILLLLFAQADIRRVFLLIVGFALPHVMLISWYYTFHATADIWNHFYVSSVTSFVPDLISGRSLLMLFALPMIYFVFSLFMMSREARLTRYQTQLLQTMLIWLMAGVSLIIFVPGLTPVSLLPLLPPLIYLMSYYLLLIRRRWLAEVSLWIYAGGVVTISLLARYEKIPSVDYSRLWVTISPRTALVHDKKILTLTDDPSLYQTNTPASFFLDWELSKEVFEKTDVIENILLLDRSFKNQLPEVIIDPQNYMSAVISRLPYLQGKYKRVGENWELVNN
jgi:hypothetical protein